MRYFKLVCGLVVLLIMGIYTSPIYAMTDSSTSAAPQTLAAVLPKAGTGFAYDMLLTGELTISQPSGRQNVQAQKQSVNLTAGLEIRWSAQAKNNIWPARINLVAPRMTAAGKTIPLKPETAQVMETQFDHSAQLLSIKTPDQLRELGLDFTTALMGLTIPMPGGSASVGTSWIVRNTITSAGLVYDIRTTYTLVGFEVRRGKTLAYIRGSTLYTPRDNPTRANSTGYLEAFVDPATGRVIESAYSLDVTNKVMLPTQQGGALEEVTIRSVITTVLLDLGPAAAEPQTPPVVKPEPEPKPEPQTPEPVPVSVVGQQPSQGINITGPVIIVEPPKTEPETPAEPVEPSVPEDGKPPVSPEPGQEETPATPTEVSVPVDVTSQLDTTVPEQPAQAIYTDPAGRYSITLPADWSVEPIQLLADTVAFAGLKSPQMIYVFSNAVDAVGLREFAENVMAEYTRISTQFRLVEMYETTIKGQPAYAAYYTYPAAGTGRIVGEVSLFTRNQGEQYIIQYTDEPAYLATAYKQVVNDLAAGFAFGPTPTGFISANVLRAAERAQYTDKLGRYKLDVPVLWPLAAQSPDGNVTTFIELAGNGYLTVYTQAGVERYTTLTVLQAWQAQWAQQEPEFRMVTNFTPVVLSNLPGVSFAYTWRNVDGRTWQRSVQAVTYNGTIYALMIDYIADLVAERSDVFSAMFSNFSIVDPSAQSVAPAEPTAPQTEATPQAPAQVEATAAPQGRAIVTGTALASTASTYRLEDPLSNTRILLAGRLGMQQGDVLTWLNNFTLRIQVGSSLYATQTDDAGYFIFANVAPLRSGSYVLRDGEGWLPTFNQPVKLTFSDVSFPVENERFIDFGYVILQALSNGVIEVEQVPPAMLDNNFEVPFYLLSTYPQSGWATIIRGTLLSR